MDTRKKPPRRRTASPSIHNLCFRSKLRKIGIPIHAPVLLFKNCVKEVYMPGTCFPDAISSRSVWDAPSTALRVD